MPFGLTGGLHSTKTESNRIALARTLVGEPEEAEEISPMTSQYGNRKRLQRSTGWHAVSLKMLVRFFRGHRPQVIQRHVKARYSSVY